MLQDYDFAGNWREIIDEFPFFSYLLADLHPHVLAMPFAFLAMAFALNVLLAGGGGKIEWFHQNLRLPVINLSPMAYLSSAIVLGAMAFLNTWDLPVYITLFAAACSLHWIQHEVRSPGSALGDFFWISLVLGIGAILLYLPFYLGFSSQAGGIIPNLIYITRGAHLWVMFAPLLLPLFVFLFHQISKDRESLKASFKPALLTTLGITIGFWLFSLTLGYSATLLPEIGQLYLSSLAAPSGAALIPEALIRRLVTPGAWLTLSVLFFLTLRLMWSFPRPMSPATTFTILLILLGTLLVFVPEFVYLRDQFGWRMNTIFKFYFQAWLLWGIAAAYASIVLWRELHGFWSWLFRAGLVLLLLMSLVYPLFSLLNKTSSFQASPKTLDSTAYLENTSPDDMAAIRWLSAAPFGVVAEAVPPGGGSYTEYARASTLSGMPSVLGWVGHESQWRGGYEEMGSRMSDLERLYCGRDSEETLSILDRYDIRYVYVGPLERGIYTPEAGNCPTGLFEIKFQRLLKSAFSLGAVTIYEYIK